MPSIKDLRKRIASVKNTQQTTKAMKMVSAAKLRRAQEAIVAQRPFAKEVGALLKLVSSMAATPLTSPLLKDLGEGQASGEKKALLVVITSDRGLCGAFNSSVIKAAERWMAGEGRQFARVDVSCVGRKGNDHFKRRIGDRLVRYVEYGNAVSIIKARELTDWILEKYTDGSYQNVYFVYNEFKNAISQIVQVERYLPLAPAEAQEVVNKTSEPSLEGADLYIIKPDHQQVAQRLLEKHFMMQTYRTFLESQASEHGARMSSMENATKNAGEMIRKLSLVYNKQRQANITKELLEIISGSESQSASA